MAQTAVKRKPIEIEIKSLGSGLNTVHPDSLIANKSSMTKAQNARVRDYILKKRNGVRYYSDQVAYGEKARATGIHHQYPASYSPSGRIFIATGDGNIYRCTKNNDGYNTISVDSNSASTENGANVSANAFDGSDATYWEPSSASAEWIRGGYTVAKVMNRVKIRLDDSTATNRPKNIIIQGFDGTTATALKSVQVADGSGTASLKTLTYGFNNSTAYLYYRIYITDCWGATCHIYDIEWQEEGEVYNSKLNLNSSWTNHDYARFVDYGDYCIAVNGKDYGAQINNNSLDNPYTFMIKKANTPTAVDSGVGTITNAGTYQYKYRYVNEISERVRNYWGAMSDAVSVTLAGNRKVDLTYEIPTDSQVTHIYIYRTVAGGGTFFYIGRIAIADAVGIYTDNTADADIGTEVDEDVVDRVLGFKYLAVDNDCLVAYGVDGDPYAFYHSNFQRPQEFATDAIGYFLEGSGKETGIASLDGNIILFKERGIGVYTSNSAGYYDMVAFYGAFGNVAPNSVMVVKEEDGSPFVTFWDNEEGPCVFTNRGPISIKRKTKDIGHFNYVTTDVVDIVENKIDKAYKKWISVGYKNGYIYFYYTPIGAQYNTHSIVYDTIGQSWFGEDIGYAAGPTFTQLGGYGVDGNGELLACNDSLSVRIIEVDANVSHDMGANIEFDVDSIRLAAENIGERMEYQKLYFQAKLGNIIRIDIDTESGYHTGSYYISPGGRYYYDSLARFDSATFDAAVAALFDEGIFDQSDMVFDGVSLKPYKLLLPSTCQGNWLEMSIYDNSTYPFAISGIKLRAVMRGYQ